MDVYLYGGRSRDNATVSVTPQNKQPEVFVQYSVPKDTGMIIVAYPSEQDVAGTFEFKYWVDEEFVSMRSSAKILSLSCMFSLSVLVGSMLFSL